MFRPPAAVGMSYAGLGLTSSRTDAGAEFGNTVEAASKAVEQKSMDDAIILAQNPAMY
ncbi:hypothetical protein PABG_03876 [Paracoccidioides brasiliensis Pb03]|nr:hypothetical protein PABG_03876 [Paracoccidioides brasiliensis Pb03]